MLAHEIGHLIPTNQDILKPDQTIGRMLNRNPFSSLKSDSSDQLYPFGNNRSIITEYISYLQGYYLHNIPSYDLKVLDIEAFKRERQIQITRAQYELPAHSWINTVVEYPALLSEYVAADYFSRIHCFDGDFSPYSFVSLSVAQFLLKGWFENKIDRLMDWSNINILEFAQYSEEAGLRRDDIYKLVASDGRYHRIENRRFVSERDNGIIEEFEYYYKR